MSIELMMILGVAALAVGAVLQLVLAVVGLRARRDTQTYRDAMQALKADLLAIRAEGTGLAERLARVEGELARIPESSEQSGCREIYDHSYAFAAKLVREGADADELMVNCGLARGEAELMMRVYGSAVTTAGASTAKAIDKPSELRPARRARTAGYEANC